MIKATELRIGNLALDQFGNIIEVDKFTFRQEIEPEGDEFKYFNPIPLTEE
jgi:hypothetical protein